MDISELDKIISRKERVCFIGSPSSTTELSIDILGSAVSRKLVGELGAFQYMQDSAPHYAIGQITEVELVNKWLEESTIRSLVRQKGKVDAVSERQDTHLGKMSISAVFQHTANGYEPSMLGTVPCTGTGIHVVDDEMLEELLHPYKEQVFYLGRVFGSQPKLPLWFKHFGKGADGAGEAYHIGLFGKTGSGKSVLAKEVLLAYARYPEMGILVLDPQGEFSKDISGGTSGGFPLPVRDILNRYNKPSYSFSVKNLVLDRWEVFVEILCESKFFDMFTIPKGTNRLDAAEVLVEFLKKKKVALAKLHSKDSFETALEILSDQKVQKRIYKSASSRERFIETLEEIKQDEDDVTSLYSNHWSPVTSLFNPNRKEARTISKALGWLLGQQSDGPRPVLVVDLSHEQAEGLFWNDKIQALIIKRILEELTVQAEFFYKKSQELNTLVVIDEAHRLAPREISRDDETGRQVRHRIVDGVRTTRKYGLGWMFISQTLSSLHQEIIQQMRIFFFGFGLGLGQEFQSIKQLVGSSESALDLYRNFRDPHSALDPNNRQYSFMTIGPVSPLSFSGSPLFFTSFNRVEDFMNANFES